jgi:dTDP-4-dehydrorhamnose reductase
MKFVVVGASGFIGRRILAEARRSGATAVGTQCRAGQSGLVRFDLLCDRLVDAAIRPIVHADGDAWIVIAAALSQIDRCLLERDVSYRINVEGTIRLLRDAVSLGLRPVFLSSSFVFEGGRGGYGDRDARAPINEYGRQKAEVESFIESELPATLVLRLDKAVGDDPTERHLFSEWWAAATNGCAIRCIANQVFSPTLVDDIGRGVVAACQRRLSGIYNLANGETMSRAALARRFAEMAALPTRIEEVSQDALGFADLRPERTGLDSRALVAATDMEFTAMRTVLRAFLRAVSP